MLKLKYRWKNTLFLRWAILSLCLLVLGIFLSIKTGVVKKKNLQNMAALNQFLPGFNDKTVGQFEAEIKAIKLQLVDLFNTFDPKESRIKKDYDLTIYFVEELGKVNDFLKLKAQDKNVTYPNLGFSEKLPSQAEAEYLLSQLYGLREVMNAGMDYGINFTSLNPLVSPAEEIEGLSGMKLVKSRVGLLAPTQSLIEFIVELTQVVPVVSLESLSLKLKDSSYEIDLTLGHIVIPPTLSDILKPLGSLTQGEQGYVPAIRRVSLEEQNLIRLLRSNNPFFVSQPKKITPAGGASKAQGPLARFFYRGKAVLKAKEVVVIEDTLNKEISFSALGEKIGGYILIKVEDERIILEKEDTKEEIIVEREK